MGGVKVVTVERWRKKGKEVSGGSDESVEGTCMYIYIWIMEERYWNWMESVKCGTI